MNLCIHNLFSLSRFTIAYILAASFPVLIFCCLQLMWCIGFISSIKRVLSKIEKFQYFRFNLEILTIFPLISWVVKAVQWHWLDLACFIFCVCGKIYIRFVILTIFKYVTQWHWLHSHCMQPLPLSVSKNFSNNPK